MRTSSLICLAVCGLLLIGCAQTEKNDMASDKVVPRVKAAPGVQREEAFARTITKELSCKYLLFLPEGYGKGEQKWPLMMFLHGAGERGSDLNLVKKHGPPKIVEIGRAHV